MRRLSRASERNIPPVFVLDDKPPEVIVDALTKGPMQAQASGLSAEDIKALAIHLAHRAPGTRHEPNPHANLCTGPPGPLAFGPSDGTRSMRIWEVRAIRQHRDQGKRGSAASGEMGVRVSWRAAYGQPTVVGDRLFLGSATGRVFALNAGSGCTYWSYLADAAVRTAVTVGLRSTSGSTAGAYFGDEKGAARAQSRDRSVALDDPGRRSSPCPYYRFPGVASRHPLRSGFVHG